MLNMVNVGKTIGWVGGLSGALALVMFAHEITFDGELAAAETRLAQARQDSDKRIIEQMLKQQELINVQMYQQFLLLRRDLLLETIERLTEQLLAVKASEYDEIARRLAMLERRLDEVQRQIESLMLGVPPPSIGP